MHAIHDSTVLRDFTSGMTKTFLTLETCCTIVCTLLTTPILTTALLSFLTSAAQETVHMTATAGTLMQETAGYTCLPDPEQLAPL